MFSSLTGKGASGREECEHTAAVYPREINGAQYTDEELGYLGMPVSPIGQATRTRSRSLSPSGSGFFPAPSHTYARPEVQQGRPTTDYTVVLPRAKERSYDALHGPLGLGDAQRGREPPVVFTGIKDADTTVRPG